MGIIVCIIIFILAIAGSSSYSVEIIDQFYSDQSNWANGISGQSAYAEAFTVQGSPTATEVRVYVWRYSGTSGSLQTTP